MEYGSKHVWMYDCSDEEYVSDTEMEKGMWLSCSDSDPDDEEEENVSSDVPKLTPFAAVRPPQLEEELEGSATKYLPPDEDEEEEEEERPTLKAAACLTSVPQSLGGSGTSNEGAGLPTQKKTLNYVEVDQLEQKGEGGVKRDKSAVNYAKIRPPPPPGAPTRKAVSAPVKGPPSPPPPPRGIIKNRLVNHRLKKVKQTRVNWIQPSETEKRRSQLRRDRGKRVRRSDTNILAVKFNKLIEPSDVHTGDPVVCGNKACSSILSHLSSLTQQEDKEEKVWVCEFCGEQNEVDVVPEEIPTNKDTTFLISPATMAEDTAGGGVAGIEGSLIVFCIDISGSMCVTTEVPGKFELKGHERVRDLSSLNVHNEDQYFPRQRRDVTYISRLQSVQAAVDYQISQLARTNPSQRVALVTFNDEVILIGDGRGETVTLAGDKLWSSEAIVKIGSEVPLPAAISTTCKALSKKIFELEETGQTALGPALLVSISMASRVPGSKVIICTDGLANKGVGNLDGLTTAEDRAAAQTFYEDMGTLSLEKNVTVSLVRIKGTDCKALELGQVADKTGGQVTTVDPLNITKEFSSILANPIIATNVRTKIVLHGQLYFRQEDSHESVLVIPVGNVTAETELTYEYGVRRSSKKPIPKGATPAAPEASANLEVPPLVMDGKPHLPFQLQVEYTGRDGSHCMRVITDTKPVTKDREQAEKDIRMGVVGSHAAHHVANLAMEGEYTNARVKAFSCQRLLQRSSHTSSNNRVLYTNLMEDLIPLENELMTKQQSERSTHGHSYSDDEGDQYFYERESDLMVTPLATPQNQAGAGPTPSPRKAAPKKKKAISRRQDISDDLAEYCYNMKKQNY